MIQRCLKRPLAEMVPHQKLKKINKNPASPFGFSGYSYVAKNIIYRVTLNDTVKLITIVLTNTVPEMGRIRSQYLSTVKGNLPPAPKVNLLSLISIPGLAIVPVSRSE